MAAVNEEDFVVLIGHLSTGFSPAQTAHRIVRDYHRCIVVGAYNDMAPEEAVEMRKSGAHATMARPVTAKVLKKALKGANKAVADWQHFFNYVQIMVHLLLITSLADLFFHICR